MTKVNKNRDSVGASNAVSSALMQSALTTFIKRMGISITKRIETDNPSVAMFLTLEARPINANGKAQWLVGRLPTPESDEHQFSRRSHAVDNVEATPAEILESDSYVFECTLTQVAQLRERNFGNWVTKFVQSTLKSPNTKFYAAFDATNEIVTLKYFDKERGTYEPFQLKDKSMVTQNQVETIVVTQIEKTMRAIANRTYDDPRWNNERWSKLSTDARKKALSVWRELLDARLTNQVWRDFKAQKASAKEPKNGGTATDSNGQLKYQSDRAKYCAILGVDVKATKTQIRDAYLAIVKANHPDIKPNDEMARLTTESANEAYQFLK